MAQKPITELMKKTLFMLLMIIVLSTTRTNAQSYSTTRFAVIGDFGKAGPNEANVANLVKSWQTDFIVTVGDNNYEKGESTTIDTNIGQYYHEYIYPYTGIFGGSPVAENRFFPALGNHDWGGGSSPAISCAGTVCTGPYLDYFTLPGNERYYDFIQGPVHFFVLDSDPREPDGIKVTSLQAAWLQQTITGSTAPWKLVVLHHPPYSSGGNHGSTPALQWPYQAWGVDAVLAGHDHHYERLVVDGLVYFVDGAGGKEIRPDVAPITGSQSIYTKTFGALLVEASAISLTFQYVDVNNTLVDSYTITTTAASTPTLTNTPTPTNTSTPTNTPTETPTPTATATNTATASATATATTTETRTETETATATTTATLIPNNTPTPTSSPTSTPTATSVPANQPTLTHTPTNTPTGTPTPTHTAVSTPTATSTQPPTSTPTPTNTTQATSTYTPTEMPTEAPTFATPALGDLTYYQFVPFISR